MKLEDKKVHGLAYADDMVLLAEEGSMRNMMKRLEEYIERKELELNREKKRDKIIIQEGKGRSNKVEMI